MQRFVLGRRNQITLVSAIVIAAAFVSKLAFKNEVVFEWALLVASILGAVPIAIQAYQALRVKV